jgi:colanic acid/amylovoran biosynthesis protein
VRSLAGLGRDPLLTLLDAEASLSLRRTPRIDAVVDISGFAYSNAWSGRPTRKALAFTRHARRAGIPHVYMPQAWGPFSTDQQKHQIRELYRGATLLYSRDSTSSSHLGAVVGVEPESIPLCPDIAFRFRGDPPESVAAQLADMFGNHHHHPLVVIAPNMRVFERSRRAADGVNAYLETLGKIIDHAVSRWNANVLMIPHEIRHRGSSVMDDRHICKQLVDQSKAPSARVAAVTNDLSAEALKALIGRADLTIGSRYHALIAALSQGCPAMALGWSHKYEELMALVGTPDACVDYSLGPESWFTRLDDTWHSRQSERARLTDVVAGIRRQVADVFDKVASTITSHPPVALG